MGDGKMSKLVLFTTGAMALATCVAIASLVLNIIILVNTNNIKTNTKNSPTNPTNNYQSPCPGDGKASAKPSYQQAANYLLNGLDLTVDPCEDFYAFTCNKFLGSVNLDELHLSRLGTYLQAQVDVNTQIVQALKNVDPTDTKVSLTERITKKATDSCALILGGQKQDLVTKAVIADVNNIFGGAPFIGGKLKTGIDLFSIAGMLEQTHALGTLFFSWVSTDYKDVSKNALYVSQPALSLPRDYYVLPQFIDKLNARKDDVLDTMTTYAAVNGLDVKNDTVATQLEKAAEDVTNFEVQIAISSWPDEMMRNYILQYNRYNLKQLGTSYPQINWSSYFGSLLDGVQNMTYISTDGVVLSQPSYFAWLQSIFDGNLISNDVIANYMIVQLLMDDGGFWEPMQKIVRKADYVPYAMRHGKGVTRLGRRQHREMDDEDPAVSCMDLIMAYMPYGPGYVYVKSQANRDLVASDVHNQTTRIISNFQKMIGTLGWMTNVTKHAAQVKSDNLVQNYGWPKDLFQDFKDSTLVDAYNQDYAKILDLDTADFYTILLTLKRGMEVREAFRLLNQPGDRSNFLQSPAMVNAWYQPERNSITFPYAAWNPPYYNFDYPQAYNYAGQGGTGGHELTHGYDDEGVQFGPDGSMNYNNSCQWNRCGWMDQTSVDGFTDMAQCVVSQFSTQCCPEKKGNVHCANGATTQGENIADLGGQQAAYFAYRQYISELGHEEERLPGLTQFTPNQIFWITYGYSWCMKQTDANLVNQLLTNPHSPAQCRTNQVMQDIPEFGKDFGCKQGSAMFPNSDQRCKVWIGY